AVLVDMREDSRTFKETNVFYMGEENPSVLLIPRGVAHGYRVLGNEPLTIVYLTTQSYSPDAPDEYRIPWNDPEINFNWQTEHR
ncbi:MAG: dTDP-4-dehydrorhamnose 3,5-epimerase family protein, partial [Novibacillus thermophilus]